MRNPEIHYGMAFVLAVVAAATVALAEDGGQAAPVRVVEAQYETVRETVELTGTVTAERNASLSSRTAGLVERVLVDAGSHVKMDDLLMELDSALARLSLERAEEEVREARTRLEEAKRLFEEGQTLARTGGIPQTEAKTRESNLHVSEMVLKQLETTARERAEILERHRLVAPFAGVVGEKYAEVGEWVETGDPVLDLVETERVRFDVQAPQELFATLGDDTRVVVRIDSRERREFSASIQVKVPVKDAVTRTFLVRLGVEADPADLVPGSSGTARFYLESDAPSVTVPRDALVRQPDGSQAVWVVDNSTDPATASMRRVETGARMDETVAILEGLDAGATVVVRGNESLQNDQPVEILDARDDAGGTP